ncbi:MAG: M23 family metallopeptidase [Synergistaceae bacterium]|nr:M23 family metallopeptidase [Synergistaceae bacterium]
MTPGQRALDVAASIPGKTAMAAERRSDIEEAAGAAISSVKGIAGLMRQAQEVSAMLPSGKQKILPAPKSDLDIALRVAAKLPSFRKPEPASAAAQKPATQKVGSTTTMTPADLARRPAVSRQKIALPGTQNLIWPVDGVIYSAFNATRGRRAHGAIDIVTQKGTPIAAAADGIVSVAANGGKKFSGYGKIVILDHGKGLYTVYAHCDSILVKMGQKVRQGEYIGTVGRTGRASTEHCHFEVRIAGKKYDPLAYLPSRPEVVKATNYHSGKKKTAK